MFKKLNITENHLKVLTLFTRGYDRGYYIREVSELSGMSPGSALIVLKDLENRGVLVSRTSGKIRVYNICDSDISKQYITIAETYKTVSFMSAYPLMTDIISKIRPSIEGICLVFGSYAKGIDKRGSDLDIFVVGDYSKRDIKDISSRYRIDIDVKRYPPGSLNLAIGKDILVEEILKDHIVISGIDRFVDEVWSGKIRLLGA